MKTVTTQQVVLLLGLLASLIVSARFATPALTAVVGAVGTLVAWLLQSPVKDDPK